MAVNVYFQGTEREVLQQNGTAFFAEDTYGIDAAYTRASARISGSGFYDCPLSSPINIGWVRLHGDRSSFGVGPPATLAELCDASNNVLVKLCYIANETVGVQYWDGSAFVQLPGAQSYINTLNFFDIFFKKGTGSGEVSWAANGSAMGDAAGINLDSYGDITHLRLYSPSNDYYSQILVQDSPTTGCNVMTVWPEADGTDTGGSGPVTNINELNMDLTTYITFPSAGDKRSTVSPARNPLPITQIPLAVSMSCRAAKTGATGPQHIRPFLIIGGVQYDAATSFALTTAADSYTYQWALNPATSSPWSLADVNDVTMEFGWEALA